MIPAKTMEIHIIARRVGEAVGLHQRNQGGVVAQEAELLADGGMSANVKGGTPALQPL